MTPPLGFLLAAAFILGVALQGSDFLTALAVLIGGGILIIWTWTESWRVLITGVIVLCFMVLGMIRVTGEPSYPAAPSALGETSTFTGTVIDVPRTYPTVTMTRLDLHEPAPTRVWSLLPPYPRVLQGDVVEITGWFLSNDQISVRGYAAQRDTSGELHGERVVVTGNEASRHHKARAAVSDEIRTRLQSRLPEPAGAFATGVILGDDGAMTESTRENFRVGGLTHMTAVSGVHVGIIAGGLLLVSKLGLVSRWWMLGLSLPVIWGFTFLVGMPPSAIRASLMLTLLVIANFLGRPRDTLNAVGIAAAVMLAIDPSFRHDIGFQLSVAATAGIALGALLIGERSHWHIVWVVPTSAQLATDPLILYHFGYYSLVSPVANILATPFLAMTMAMSILTVCASFISSVLADALAIGTWLPASAVVMIADFAVRIPYLSGELQPLSYAGVWIGYVLLIGVVALLSVLLSPGQERFDSDVIALYRV